MATTSLPDRAAIEAVFDQWDANKDGTISREEFSNMMNSLTSGAWSVEMIGNVFDAADADRNGRLDFTELLNWVWAEDKNRALFQKKDLSAAEEAEKMQGVEQAANGLTSGKHYFLISRKWYNEWVEWTGLSTAGLKRETSFASVVSGGGGSPPAKLSLELQRSWTKERPGPINNSGLFDPGEPGKLNRGICEHRDYEILSKAEWELLLSWYGGGPAIKRRAISQPSGSVMLELYGLTLKVYVSTDLSAEPKVMIESKTTTAATFKKHACEEFGLEPSKVRVWDYFNQRKIVNLEPESSKSLDFHRIYDENDMLLEVQLENGKWPEDKRYSASTVVVRTEDVPTTGRPVQTGAVGLQNLGNTCFMNSSIQCLSNQAALREYFVTEKYKDELNPTAYKTAGKLATAYAQLMVQMWNPNHCQVAPRNFKWQIGQFAEQFAGFGQQDSMEFMEYLLDGLKEDLNRVQGTKPFVELKEAEGRTDAVVAEEALQGYLKRNNSSIDELFLGFFKSTITCPEPGCGRVSVTFDPFLSVKLSLMSTAAERALSFKVLVIPLPGAVSRSRSALVPLASAIEPRWLDVSVAKFGTASSLIEATAKQAGLDTASCILTEFFSGKVYKFFDPIDALDRIAANDVLVLYELENVKEFQIKFEERWYGGGIGTATSKKLNPGEKCGLVIYQRQMRTIAGSYAMHSTADVIGLPMLTSVETGVTGKALIDIVRNELSNYIGSRAEGSWKLFRTSDKWAVSRCDNQVEADDTALSFEQREYLIIEWPEKVVIPEVDALQELLNKNKKKYGGVGGGGGRSSAEAVSLQKCFGLFTETDQLPATDAWYCNRCKEHREAFKKMEFWTLPPVLILQLKRFTYSEWCRDRLDTPVAFPLEGLDLSSYCVQEGLSLMYDLSAVSIHLGGMGGGHYVAYARSSENGKWHKYDDSSVREVTPPTVADDNVGAYVLFYVRRDHRPPGWGDPVDPPKDGDAPFKDVGASIGVASVEL